MENKFDQLLKIMSKLRGPEGCPWDKEQTHQSLIPYLIEESYEVIDAIQHHNPSHIKEELGDLLLQIIFHAQISKEENQFTIDDIIESLNQKLIRRHPHVFSDSKISTSDEVNTQWEEIKQKEKEKKPQESVLDSIPKSLPALFEAYKLGKKASQLGFDWDNIDGAFEKLEEELNELKEAIKSQSPLEKESEMGDLLFSITNICRHLKIKPEIALNQTNLKFRKRFSFIEKNLKNKNINFKDCDLKELDHLWKQAKKEEKNV